MELGATTRGSDRHEPRQVLVLRPEAVQRPRTEGGPYELNAPCVELRTGLGMRREVRVHAAQETQIVRVLGNVREQLANPKPALPPLLEGPRASEQLGPAAVA